jgi:hypothetical protein
MTLYADPTVTFGKQQVGGIRISHLSGLESDRVLMLTTTRSRRSGYTVKPLRDMPAVYPAEKFQANLPAWTKAISEGKVTIPQLIAKVAAAGQLTAEQIAEIERSATPQPTDDASLK